MSVVLPFVKPAHSSAGITTHTGPGQLVPFVPPSRPKAERKLTICRITDCSLYFEQLDGEVMFAVPGDYVVVEPNQWQAGDLCLVEIGAEKKGVIARVHQDGLLMRFEQAQMRSFQVPASSCRVIGKVREHFQAGDIAIESLLRQGPASASSATGSHA